MKLTPKRWLLFAILALASVAPLVMTLRSKPKLQQPVAPGVEVVQVIQKDVPVYREWIGTLDGMVNAEIKAQRHRLSDEAGLHGRFRGHGWPTTL